jgi:hypothetical protein
LKILNINYDFISDKLNDYASTRVFAPLSARFKQKNGAYIRDNGKFDYRKWSSNGNSNELA